MDASKLLPLWRQAAAEPRGYYLYPRNCLPVSIAVILGGMVLSLMLIGLRSPFWARAASDLVSAYEGLLYNQGVPQEFLAYPAVLSGQLLGLWYRLLHAVGLLAIDRVSDLPQAPTVAQFDVIWQALITWARVYSLLLGMIYVGVFMVLINRLTGAFQIAALAGVALAFSSGVALEFRIIRSELLSSGLIAIALLATILAARERGETARLAWLALAGFCTALGYIEKVQALLPAMAIPFIALAFPPIAATGATVSGDEALSRQQWRTAAVIGALALVCLIPVLRLMLWGMAAMPTHAYIGYPPLGGGMSGRYQWLIALWVGGAMLAYGWYWRVRPAETAAALAAVVLGLALGLAVLFLRSHPQVVVAVANPLEHLQAHAGALGAGLPSDSLFGAVGKLIGTVATALAIHTLVFYPSHRPTLIVEWLAIAAAVVLWHRGDRQRCLQIAVLLVSAFGLDGLFSLRQYKVFYLPFTDPLIIVAGAIAATPFLGLLVQRNIQQITMVLMTVYVVWGHAQAARIAYGDADKAGKICGVVAQFTTRISWPYCLPR